MRVINDAVESVPLDKLRTHPQNPREGDVGAIYQSIEANGFYGAIVAQKSTGRALAGNHRLMAATEAGAEELPVVWVDVDDETALRILLADNRTNDLASYDEELLADLLESIVTETGTLDGTGYDGDALDELLNDLGRELDVPEDPGADTSRTDELREQWGTERGQVWEIPSGTVPGKSHRLMCGDSTNEEDVGRLLDGTEPQLMVTDPPYGVEYDPGWRNDAAQAGATSLRGAPGGRAVGEVQNDNRADWRDAWALFPGDVAYVWHGALHSHTVAASLLAANFEMRAQVIWNKARHVISRGHYHWKHEPCWYAVRKGRTAHWKGDRSQMTVWDIPHTKSETGHGTQKPIEAMLWPIRNHGGDVYDPFLGSGTTVVAAEGLRRVCYGMEIDPGYVAVILERLSGMGLEPVLAESMEVAA